MDQLDWTTFTRKINIAASKDAILNAWLSQEELEKWFLSSAKFFQGDNLMDRNKAIEPGQTYKWMWHTSENVAEGQVLEVGSDNLSFTFLGCDVHVTIAQEVGEQILTLIQSKIPTDESGKMGTYVECTRGWTFYMTNLKSILEGGLDLRNKNDAAKNMIST